ncbi:MAG: lipopolysaccharide heptosyltransferase I [Epsilonproteobacteria bacterium]|nr:lipopolysaccharide heptosyltransferase I [Campylobacterota bacterium]
MRVALVRLTAMGDVIHALAAVQFVKARYPHLHLSWFVEEKFAAVLADNPDVDTVVPLRLHDLKKRPSPALLKANLKKVRQAGPFDLVIDVQGLMKSAAVARAAGKNVAGLDAASIKEKPAALLYRRRYRIDCADIAPMRFATLIAKALNFTIDRSMMAAKRPYLFYREESLSAELVTALRGRAKRVLIVTGASNASKTYPTEGWIEVVRGLADCDVRLVAGSSQEREAARRVAQATHAELLPPTDLNGLKYAVSRADLLIGNDTGPTHMAWALNRPSIVLFGSTPRSMMFETSINVAITSGAKVHPCRFDKTDRSIAQIPPQTVIHEAKRLLA